MSVAYILDKQYSSVLNSKLNQELEVSTSLKAPVHYISNLSLSKNNSGNLSINAPVVECTQIQAPLGVINSVNVDEVIPYSGVGGKVTVQGNMHLGGNFTFNQTYGKIIEGVVDYAGSACSFIAQNKNGDATASSNIYLMTDDATTQDSNYSVIGLNNSNYNIGSDTVDSQKKGLYIANTNADVSIIGNYLNGGSVHLGYNQGSNAISVMNSGAVSLGTTFSSSTNQYTYNAGSAGQVLKSAGANAPAYWGTDENSASQWSSYPALQNVNLNEFGIQNLKTLTITGGDAGLSGQLLSVGNDGNLAWVDDKNTPANWYLYPAQDTVQFNNNDIQDAKDVYCVQVKSSYLPAKSWWVSTSGDDNNYGNENNPFLTITQALSVASAGDTIYLYSGNYNENLTITKPVNIKGVGVQTTMSSLTQMIVGDITIAITSGDAQMFNNVIGLSNLYITGIIEANSACTTNFVLLMDSCSVYKEGNNSGRLLHFNPDNCTDARLRLSNCKFQNNGTSGTSPLIEVNLGMVRMTQCELTTASASNVLKLSNFAKVDSITLTQFNSASTSTTAPELVLINSTGSPACTFSNCAFIYSSNSDKSNNINSCAIRTGAICFVVLLYNFFSLSGTIPFNGVKGNYILRDDNSGNPASQANILFFSNNSGYDISVGMGGLIYTQQANELQGVMNSNKRTLQAVA